MALASEAFGMSATAFPSRNYVKKLKRFGSQFTRHIIIRELQEWLAVYLQGSDLSAFVLAQENRSDVPDMDPQVIYVRYTSALSTFSPQQGLLQIRFSVRSYHKDPVMVRQRDLLSSHIPGFGDQLSSFFYVKSVPVKQVLLEKAFLLHELFQRREVPASRLEGQSRHLYDLVKIVDHAPLEQLILDKALYRALRLHRKFWYHQKEVRYNKLNLKRLCFIPPLQLLGIMMDDYRRLRRDVLFDTRYDFTELIGRVQEINGRLNGLQWPKKRSRQSSVE
ncbi:MAG TPA: nucleotidyl transferase AbiEii/AbiGii toxin family protein [Arachidicoccus sp.]|nr:nucleotidyl transferase AbiEii/AbiGii toxin family protein [Arachidicoccus sp.]